MIPLEDRLPLVWNPTPLRAQVPTTVLPHNMGHAVMAAPRDERANSLVLNQHLGGNTSGPHCAHNRSSHSSETYGFVWSPSGPPSGSGDLVAGLPGH